MFHNIQSSTFCFQPSVLWHHWRSTHDQVWTLLLVSTSCLNLASDITYYVYSSVYFAIFRYESKIYSVIIIQYIYIWIHQWETLYTERVHQSEISDSNVWVLWYIQSCKLLCILHPREISDTVIVISELSDTCRVVSSCGYAYSYKGDPMSFWMHKIWCCHNKNINQHRVQCHDRYDTQNPSVPCG